MCAQACMDVRLHILSVCVCAQCGLALVSVSLVSRRSRRADPQARCVERSGHAQRLEATGTEGRRGSDEGRALAPPPFGIHPWNGGPISGMY